MKVAPYFTSRVTVPDHTYSFRDVYSRNAFAHEAATSLRQWQSLFAELYRDFNLARRAKDPLEEFMQYGRLHLDPTPVPEHIWHSLPNVECGEGKQLQITIAGREKLAACLRARDGIYQEGFVLPV